MNTKQALKFYYRWRRRGQITDIRSRSPSASHPVEYNTYQRQKPLTFAFFNLPAIFDVSFFLSTTIGFGVSDFDLLEV